MQKKESFCFVLGCFIRLSPKSCSPTETETYRNRKFDPETEISASESDFRFRLCSTPNIKHGVASISSTYPGQSVDKWYFRISILPASLSPHKASRWHCGDQHDSRHEGGHGGRHGGLSWKWKKYFWEGPTPGESYRMGCLLLVDESDLKPFGHFLVIFGHFCNGRSTWKVEVFGPQLFFQLWV